MKYVLFAMLLAACGGDDGGGPIDARLVDGRTDGAPVDGAVVDGPDVDAAPDAAIDAAGIDAPPVCQQPIRTFVMDGAVDASATVIAGGATTIRIATAFSGDGRLYVATDDAGEGSDHFVLLSATPPGATTVGAPFGKAGTVAVGTGPTLFLADENDNDFSGWFRLNASGGDTLLDGAAYATGTGANGGVVEGAIDLVAAFGAVPATVYLSAVLYASGDGGALVPAAQTPQGDGDGDVDAAEVVALPITCDAASR